MFPRRPRLAVRRHRKVAVILAVSIALALSGLGTESASASTRSRLALSLNSDRSNAVRLDGSTVKGQIYVFVRDSETLDKVDFYLDGRRRTKSPVQTDTKPPFDFAGTAADGTAVPYDTKKLADGSHRIKVVLTWSDGTTSSRRANSQSPTGGHPPRTAATTAPPATTPTTATAGNHTTTGTTATTHHAHSRQPHPPPHRRQPHPPPHRRQPHPPPHRRQPHPPPHRRQPHPPPHRRKHPPPHHHRRLKPAHRPRLHDRQARSVTNTMLSDMKNVWGANVIRLQMYPREMATAKARPSSRPGRPF